MKVPGGGRQGLYVTITGRAVTGSGSTLGAARSTSNRQLDTLMCLALEEPTDGSFYSALSFCLFLFSAKPNCDRPTVHHASPKFQISDQHICPVRASPTTTCWLVQSRVHPKRAEKLQTRPPMVTASTLLLSADNLVPRRRGNRSPCSVLHSQHAP